MNEAPRDTTGVAPEGPGDPATETATIRVPRATRDRLARRARERGVSLASMLTEYAETLAREAIYRSEREATRADARDPHVAAEERDCETLREYLKFFDHNWPVAIKDRLLALEQDLVRVSHEHEKYLRRKYPEYESEAGGGDCS